MTVPPASMRADAWLDLRENLPTTAGHRVFHSRGWGSIPDPSKLAALRDLAEKHGRDPRLRNLVIQEVLRGGMGEQAQRDYPRQAAALLKWVQDNILYVTESGEQLQSPAYTLRVKHGDCDDMAILLAAMAESIRMPWRYVLAGRHKGRPVRWLEPAFKRPGQLGVKGLPPREMRNPPRGASWHHIYVALGWPPYQPSEWRAAEPTVKGAPLGYDVVEHGIMNDAHLRDRRDGGAMTELSGYGAVVPAEGFMPAVVEKVKSRLTPVNLITSIVEALIIGAIVGAILRRKRR